MRNDRAQGLHELRQARRESMGPILSVFLFSVCVNALMLTGPLYMLQVYDRVLGSRSEATLVALSVLIAFLFLMMGILDHVRGRVMARAHQYTRTTLTGEAQAMRGRTPFSRAGSAPVVAAAVLILAGAGLAAITRRRRTGDSAAQ